MLSCQLSPLWSVNSHCNESSSISFQSSGSGEDNKDLARFDMSPAPAVFVQNVEKSVRVSPSEASMWLEIICGDGVKRNAVEIKVVATARQIELYTSQDGANSGEVIYNSTVRGSPMIAGENNRFDFDISLPFAPSRIRVKFLSLRDPSRKKLDVDSFSLLLPSNVQQSHPIQRPVQADTDQGVEFNLGQGGMAFLAKAVCQLVDSKLEPVLGRLSALEDAMLRQERDVKALLACRTSDVRYMKAHGDEKTDEKLVLEKASTNTTFSETLKASAVSALQNADRALDNMKF